MLILIHIIQIWDEYGDVSIIIIKKTLNEFSNELLFNLLLQSQAAMPPLNNGIPQYRGEIKNENTAYENIWGKKR